MNNYGSWDDCIKELRQIKLWKNQITATKMKKIKEITSYMDEHYKTEFNITEMHEGRWIGPSCKDCDDYECSESQFVSCEMSTWYKPGYFIRMGEEIEPSKILDLLNEWQEPSPCLLHTDDCPTCGGNGRGSLLDGSGNVIGCPTCQGSGREGTQ